MRRLLFTAAGLALAALAGPGLAYGSEKGGKAVPPGRPASPLLEEPQSCGKYGTTVEFVDTPTEAAKKAKKEQKLVLILHVSGNFEDPRFT